ncbi:MAG: pyridoxal phosphate-dependent aminotransferase [Planctomycetota bacterium]|jgi:aspartate aminotransferase
MGLSDRISNLKPSATLAVTGKAKQMRADGHDVLSFAAGEPDFVTPQRVIDAAKRALDEGHTGYAPVPGEPSAREAIAWKLREENEIAGVSPEHVMITVGGKGGLYAIFQSLFDELGDESERGEFILPVPAWVSYAPVARLAGARVVEIETDASNDFKITPDQLREAITPNSRALLINSPSNPCGTMYAPEDLCALAQIIAEHPDLIVISDEIYEKIIFGGISHLSIGSLDSIAEQVITVGGMSKAYAMTGWRLGYVAGTGNTGLEIVKACSRLQGQMATGPATFCQIAIPTALHECADDVERMRQAFSRRGELIHTLLSEIEGIECRRPTGAFYAFPDVSSFFGSTSASGRAINSPMDFATSLLEEHHVAVIPGEAFGGCGNKCVRFSFACSDEQIVRGMERLSEFVAGLRQDSPV